MGRVLRSLALVGLALALCSQAPKERTKTDQQKPQAQEAQPTPPIALDAKPIEPVQPSEYYRPCDREWNDRNSDLCAQWTAAEGARDAAYWAYWSFWLSFAGLVGLMGSLHYTRKAVLAAEEGTKDADAALAIARDNADYAAQQVKVAEDTAKRELRAYVGPGQMAINTNANHLSLDVRNVGSTPARDVMIEVLVRRLNSEHPGSRALGIIDPTAMAHHVERFDDKDPVRPSEIPGVRIDVTVSYVDIFDRKWVRKGTYIPPLHKLYENETSFHFFADGSGNEEVQEGGEEQA